MLQGKDWERAAAKQGSELRPAGRREEMGSVVLGGLVRKHHKDGETPFLAGTAERKQQLRVCLPASGDDSGPVWMQALLQCSRICLCCCLARNWNALPCAGSAFSSFLTCFLCADPGLFLQSRQKTKAVDMCWGKAAQTPSPGAAALHHTSYITWGPCAGCLQSCAVYHCPPIHTRKLWESCGAHHKVLKEFSCGSSCKCPTEIFLQMENSFEINRKISQDENFLLKLLECLHLFQTCWTVEDPLTAVGSGKYLLDCLPKTPLFPSSHGPHSILKMLVGVWDLECVWNWWDKEKQL